MLTTGRHKKTVANVILGQSYTGQNGLIHKHKITFTDGDSGEYHSTSDTQNYFVQNKEVEFECEVKINGGYTNYKLKPIKDAPGKAPFKPASPNGMLAVAALNASIELYKAKEIPKEKVEDATRNFYKLLTSLVAGS